MENEALAVIGCVRRLAGKCFDIVVDVLGSMGRLIEMECHVLVRHDVDVDNDVTICTAALRHPALALVVSPAVGAYDGEVVTDGLAIERCDFFDRPPIRRAAGITGAVIRRTFASPSIVVCPVIA